MRLSAAEHFSRPWRVHELTRDFRLEDVWALPVTGGRDDFGLLVAGLAAGDPAHGPSAVSRLLWAVRWKLGDWLGWDGPGAGLGTRVPTLRGRLPADLRQAPGPGFAVLPFSPLYLLPDEFAAEIANQTVHGVLHVGWVPDGTGRYRGQMAVLVRPNGMLGVCYLAAIKPLRYLVVYPQLMRDMARQWRDATAGPAAPAPG
jgi:hypothetical protein